MLKKHLYIILLFAMLGSSVFAEERQIALTSASFNPAEMPSSTVCQSPEQNIPVKDYLKIWQGALPKEWFYFRLENALYKLKFYPELPDGQPSEKLTNAIKAFQKSIKTEPTGHLLVCEWVELVKRVNELFPRYVYPSRIYPVPLSIFMTDDFVKAEGTWQLQNSNVQFPFLQTSDIRCYRGARTCVEANAMIIQEPDMVASVDRNYLTVEPIIWAIQNWNDEEIVANNNGYNCLRASLYVNFANKKIYKLYRFYPGPNCGAYANKNPHIFDFVDGMEYAQGFYKDEYEKVGSFYNPDYLKRINRLKDETS